MAIRSTGRSVDATDWLSVEHSATLPTADVLETLGSSTDGLSAALADARRAATGPNAVRSHRAEPLTVLGRQLRNPLLVLLLVAAGVSFGVGEHTDAIIIAGIVALSVGLGFVNEYRAELATQALHSQLRHRVVAKRDGTWAALDVIELVPGDIVRLELGAVVPADLRLLATTDLACDESVLTGESLPIDKDADVVAEAGANDLRGCALMGTIVRAGSAEAVVVATGGHTQFGAIALGLGMRQPVTEFQAGLREFSTMLVWVAGLLTSSIFVINLILRRPVLDALLFSLAIAVGITPQLLPAVVTTSLAAGSRRLATRKVLVKRLVCIEDLGNVEVLLTDKTGTLTEGRIDFEDALDPLGRHSDAPLLLGLLANEATVVNGAVVGANALDAALWGAPAATRQPIDQYTRVALKPFDHDRRCTSVLVDGPGGRQLITKGAPETVLAMCSPTMTSPATSVLADEFARGARVVAVASGPADGATGIDDAALAGLTLAGFLVFRDLPKASAADAIARLQQLGIAVRVITGDNAVVAEHVCAAVGLRDGGTLTGDDIDLLSDDELISRLGSTRVFARMNPQQKARLIELHRRAGSDVAYLGDGVNDAVALHKADVGISVESATDVARDAADIVLLEKDLHVLADGVAEGRRIFANTIKYVLMGTSSNFGNMFSAAAASAFLPFLPMLPSQILLNNLLYDAGQMTIPTDRVDADQLARPAHWDISFIRRFMLFFGPISSLFDFITFAVMLHVFDADAGLFRSGWFVESLATQSLVIFVIRTRRTPFWRSRPSAALLWATIGVVVIGAVLPLSPLAHTLGFRHLPLGYFAVLAGMVVAYLAFAEIAKREFFAHSALITARRDPRSRRLARRASRFSQGR